MAAIPSERLWFKTARESRRPRAGRRSRVKQINWTGSIEPLEGRTLLASNWTTVALAPSNVGTMTLLSDGTVMAQQAGRTATYFKLTPSATGSYAAGTWTTLATSSLQRLYTGSNLMQNGNLFVLGGEYSGTQSAANWTNTGEIYNTATNSWSSITNFPNSQFGDDPTILLPNGNILAGYLSGPQTYIYYINATTDLTGVHAANTWAQTGTAPGVFTTKNHSDRSDEETWIKLPDDSILSYDIFNTVNGLGNTGQPNVAQRFIPSTGQWVDTGTVPVALSSNAVGAELGPAALLPNGKVFQVGGNNNTAIFDPSTDTSTGGGTWTAGPTIPGGYVADDAAGVLLPNGHFLFTADQTKFVKPTHVFDYDYTNNTITDITPTVANGDPTNLSTALAADPSFICRFLMLPNGQALLTDGASNELYLYTGTGAVNTTSTPAITTVTPTGGNNYSLTGTALNGAYQGASYGDDAEMDSNYPIVSLVNGTALTYGRSTGWNKTGIGVTNGSTSTNFSLPTSLLTVPAVTAVAPAAAEGTALSNVAVATFTDPNGNHTGSYTTLITWGDGAQTAGVVTGPVSGVYTVSGSHTYAEEGAETISVQVTDTYTSLNVSASGVTSAPYYYANSTTGSSITVSDPSMIGTGGFTFNAVAGTLSTVQTVATFTDPGGAEPLADYSASINWGDGTSAGTITGPVAGVFTVTAAHNFAAAGTPNIAVTISHETTTPTVVNDTGNVTNSTSTVTNVTSSTANGTYGVSKTILINVSFSATETVTGIPQLALNSGGTANYTSGSGSSTLTFTYIVGAGDSSAHLDYTGTSALTLNGGTINGPGSVAASLTLPSPGAAGSLSANSSIVIDTVAPTVVAYDVLFGTGQSYNLIGSSRTDLPWTITGVNVVFSKPIAAADASSLTGLTTTGIVGLGTSSITWTITPLVNGTFSTSLLGTGVHSIQDAAGNTLTGGTGFSQNFKVLYGDFNGDGIVNAVDMSGVASATTSSYNIFADLNGDGSVDINDVKIARSRIGSKQL